MKEKGTKNRRNRIWKMGGKWRLVERYEEQREKE
jgi:hypothetical protein